MATAKEYIRVRNKAPQNDQLYSEVVDDRPYFPLLSVNPNDEETIKEVVAKIVFDSSAANRQLEVEKVTGGNTNVLYRVSAVSGGITNLLFKVDKEGENLSVLVRIFGAPGLIDRDVENSNYAALAREGIAPPYHGRFANGRIEGFLKMRTLKVKELGDFLRPCAVKLALLHTNFNFKGEKEEEPTMWKQLRSWMDQAIDATFKTESDKNKASKLDLASLVAELDWLQESVVPKGSKTAFCHNDLLAANILVADDTIQLIDFEYGGINYVAFDIANHFNEFAGGTDDGVPNYDWFPDEAKQRLFITEYLRTVLKADPSHQQVEELLTEVQAYVLVNHLYWGLWAVNQASTEGCDDFDYLLYASHRIGHYRKTKT